LLYIAIIKRGIPPKNTGGVFMKKILIVDDSRVSRKMLSNMLEKSGFEVVAEAINGKEGYELYAKLSPDVVLMDITMPEMNGLDSMRLIKEHNPDAKVIIISAAGQMEKKEEAMAAGATAFITKPYSNQEIIDTINYC
jgi:two-component system chemotaxis response regulator CheY